VIHFLLQASRLKEQDLTRRKKKRIISENGKKTKITVCEKSGKSTELPMDLHSKFSRKKSQTREKVSVLKIEV